MSRAATVLGAILLAGSASGAGAQAVERHLTEAERAVLGAAVVGFLSPEASDAALGSLLRQLRRNPPVAFIDGYWATPVDLSAILQTPVVRAGIDAALVGSPVGAAAADLLADPPRLRRLAALAFTAQALAAEAELPFVGEFPQVTRYEAGGIGIVLVPLKDAEDVVVEYTPPGLAAPDVEPECYFFCGAPTAWDFDADGTPNGADPDDDGDGAPDAEDHYPYWPGGADCRCEAETFFAVTSKFSAGVTRAVLAAFRDVAEPDPAAAVGTLGPAPGGRDEVRFVFPVETPRTEPPWEEPPPPEAAVPCPDPTDPGVRYIDRDPDMCARLRFRCEKGETAFSDACGCGCRRP